MKDEGWRVEVGGWMVERGAVVTLLGLFVIVGTNELEPSRFIGRPLHRLYRTANPSECIACSGSLVVLEVVR